MASKRQIDEAAKRVLGNVGDPQPRPDWTADDYRKACKYHTSKGTDAGSDEESARHYKLSSKYYKQAQKLGWKIHQSETRKWRGYDVDVELTDQILERVNKAADRLGGQVSSVCAGHPEGDTSAGGDQHPDYIIGFTGQGTELEEKTERLAARLRGPDTKVSTSWWSGKNANAVTHADGQSREHVFRKPSPYFPADYWERLRNEGTTRTSVQVKCTIAHDGSNQDKLVAWWEQTLRRLENAKV